MKKKNILLCGHCRYDSDQLSGMLSQNFEILIHRASTQAETINHLITHKTDMVLINRIFAASGESGLDLINSLKTRHPAVPTITLMLISDRTDAQQAAIKLGADPGFGKSSLYATETLDLLKKYLVR